MKIAISSKGTNLNSEIDERFGRCPYFIIAEVSGKKCQFIECVKNDAAEQSGAAGAFAAKLVAQKGASAVITGEVGPNALQVLSQFGIRIFKASGNIGNALQKMSAEAKK